MKKLLVLAVLAAACGDNNKATPGDGGSDASDAGVDAPVDAPRDAPPDAPPAATFTSFVIDQIQNQTSSTTNPVPFATFMGLPDPDSENPAAYNVLFP